MVMDIKMQSPKRRAGDTLTPGVDLPIRRTTKTPEKSTSTSISDGFVADRYAREQLAQAYVQHADRELERAKVSALQTELPEPVHAEPVIGEKVTSPELAKLASEYLNMTDEAFATHVASLSSGRAQAVARDVRRLAASVLSQAEGGVK